VEPKGELYDKKCNVPIIWSNPADRITLGPIMLKEMGQEIVIKI
jgi:hypothetical protein